MKSSLIPVCLFFLLQPSNRLTVPGTGEVVDPHQDIVGEFKNVGKDTTKTGHFPISVGHIERPSCLEKVGHPYESRIRHQYAMRRRRTTVHEKVLYSRERGNVRDRLDSRAASRTTNMIEDAAQAPLSVAR